ncbi:hypothetical protein EDC94DRAFT_620306 [Helicostylum pulchrum]|nr:hypothetical protein EDC94DRAFT_620306 [Helicostylum pulchrum]
MYALHNGEWIDGHRPDVTFAPITSLSSSLPLIVVQVQNVIDKPFIHRLQKYCNRLCESFDNIEPIVLTICLGAIGYELAQDFKNADKCSFVKISPSAYWARRHFIMSPATIDGCLNEPLKPLLVLGYVFMEQKFSLLDLELRNDETAKLIYSITEEVLDREKRPHDAVVEVCRNIAYHFKRTLEATNEDESPYLRTIEYAKAGKAYTEACLDKYKTQRPESSVQEPSEPPKDAEMLSDEPERKKK